MSRFFANGNGANNDKKDQLALSSDDEDDTGIRSGSPSSRVTPGPDSKRQQQHLSPPSPDDRALQGSVTRGKGGFRDDDVTTLSPMSFSDALNKVKATAAQNRGG